MFVDLITEEECGGKQQQITLWKRTQIYIPCEILSEMFRKCQCLKTNRVLFGSFEEAILLLHF